MFAQHVLALIVLDNRAYSRDTSVSYLTLVP